MGDGNKEEIEDLGPTEMLMDILDNDQQRFESEVQQWRHECEFEQWWKTLEKDSTYIEENINGRSNGSIRAETEETLSGKPTKVEAGT